MKPTRRTSSIVALVVALLPPAVARGQQKPADVKAAQAVNRDAQAIADFKTRVDEYVALRKKADDSAPPLKKTDQPRDIKEAQQGLVERIGAARSTAKQGDIFTPRLQQFIRTLLRPIFSGKDGLQIKNEILDKEYKGEVKLAVNGRYPDEVPVSTMPPQVLAALPKLPEEIEYRFIQNNMILFDPHAHIIVDFMVRAF